MIRQNLEMLGAQSEAEIMQGEALRALARLHGRGEHADFIFLDPPYDDEAEYGRVLELLGYSAPLAPLGTIVFEHRSTLELPQFEGKLERTRRVRQGDATLSFYRFMPGG